jgi:3-phenylpropionate/cinnamic acid dioxygenase small subunit
MSTPDHDPTALFAEYRRVVDEAEIRDLAARYCWAIDTLDREAFGRVFTPDATALLGNSHHEGIDDIWSKVESTLGPLTCSQHLVGSHVVEIDEADGDRARHRCQFHAQHVRDGVEGGSQFVVAGSYTDDVVRTPDGWRIHRRVLQVSWTSGNPKVTRP